ncbi:MAG: hypothetical protein IKO51_02065 [Clostridia bacterium]|nr:hypothetical protein [Clostridia bacterium]
MKLLGVEKRGAWLYSEWRLTYPVGWESILNAVALCWQYMKEPELLLGDAGGEKQVPVDRAEEVKKLDESGTLTIRGFSTIVNVPLMLVFFNQSDMVRLYVACATEEFAEADYREFNLSMCQFMDSAELAMYR